MHHKEKVMAPLLEQQLGVQIVVPQDFNTDAFGTFTRQINRPGDQRYTARLKAEAAMDLTGLSLSFASEGSFGPHPALPYLSYCQEMVILVDRHHDLEIIGQSHSTETNYCAKSVTSLEEAQRFAQKVGFPTHGLIALSEAKPTASSVVFKGITTDAQLRENVTELLRQFGQAHLETDMRAMYNPSRMKVIAQATQDLLRKLNQFCPQCGVPGFDVVERQPGLPCELCGLPTPLALTAVQRCQRCSFDQIIPFPNGQKAADPAQCAYCNP
jgi:hypothetical protein